MCIGFSDFALAGVCALIQSDAMFEESCHFIGNKNAAVDIQGKNMFYNNTLIYVYIYCRHVVTKYSETLSEDKDPKID